MPVRRMTLSGVIAAVLMLGACISMGTPVVFNESVPRDESVNIYFYYGIEITAYNGIPVPVKKNSLTSNVQSEWRNMILPAGEIEFTLNIAAAYGSTMYSAKDVTFRHRFEPSEDLMYIIDFTANGGANRDEWGLNIYKQSPKEKLYPLKTDNLAAYIPFQRNERVIFQ